MYILNHFILTSSGAHLIMNLLALGHVFSLSLLIGGQFYLHKPAYTAQYIISRFHFVKVELKLRLFASKPNGKSFKIFIVFPPSFLKLFLSLLIK